MSDEDYGMIIGEYRDDVTLELVKDPGISRPRMMPVGDFPSTTRVEVSRRLREMFPLGTQFKARVKVCQKHARDGSPIGNPYLRVCDDIGVLEETIKNPGLVARLDPGGSDSRKYYYLRRPTK